MNFRQKLLAYSAAVTAAVALAPQAHSGEVQLSYERHAVGSGAVESYWKDMEDLYVQHGELEPAVLVAEFEASGGRRLTVSVLASMGACGLNECPVRIFEGGEKIADFHACSNTDFHAVNDTGSLFLACDAIIDVPEAQP